MIKKIFINFISFIDRNYNLLFKKKDIVKLHLNFEYKYNDIITSYSNNKTVLRYLGKEYFKTINK